MRSYHTPGSHHVQKWPALVPYDMKHGLTQSEKVKSTALVLCGLSLPFNDRTKKTNERQLKHDTVQCTTQL